MEGMSHLCHFTRALWTSQWREERALLPSCVFLSSAMKEDRLCLLHALPQQDPALADAVVQTR